MAQLKEKIKTGLDEDRMLVLVVQVLLGFEYRAVFEPGFEKLSQTAQYLKLASGGVLLLTLALLLTVPAYHRLVERGEATSHFNQVLRQLMRAALLPFAIALGMDLAIVGNKLFGVGGGAICGVLTTGAALCF